jgi:hypothetical protein
MRSPLESWLAELKATPKLKAALASNALAGGEFCGVKVKPKPAAEVLEDVERWIAQAVTDDSPLVIEIHDRLCEIVRRNIPMREKFTAFIECLQQYDAKRQTQ